jgi:hypothetical protein
MAIIPLTVFSLSRLTTMSEKKIYGSCLCGTVTYDVTLPSTPTVNFCYCSHCRKSSASLFDAYIMIPKTAITILTGNENLMEHSIKGDSGYPVKRSFCKGCGTRVMAWCENPQDSAMFDGVGALTMGIGTLDVPTEQIDKWKKGEKLYEGQRALVMVD